MRFRFLPFQSFAAVNCVCRSLEICRVFKLFHVIFVFGAIMASFCGLLCGSTAKEVQKLERKYTTICSYKDDLIDRRGRLLSERGEHCDTCKSLIDRMKQVIPKKESLPSKSLPRKELKKEVHQLLTLMDNLLEEYREHDPKNESSHTVSRRMISSKFEKNLKQSSEAAKVPPIGDNGGMVSEISHMDVEVQTESEGGKAIRQTSTKQGKGKEKAYGSIGKNPEVSEAPTSNSLKVASEIVMVDEVQISNPNPGALTSAAFAQSVQEFDFPADDTAGIFAGE